MPSTARRGRRVHVREDEESEEEVPHNTQRRRPAASDESEDEDEDQRGEGMDVDGRDSQDQVVKKLVRYALACEFQRIPISRSGIKEKVLGHYRGKFNVILQPTQEVLRRKFGMELVELPTKENVTVKGRLKDASKKSKTNKSSAYILTSILPLEYRLPAIIPPSKVVSQWEEATYIGFYTTIVSMIMLSPDGTISDSKFTSFLKKLEADKNIPIGQTTNILKRMEQHNYITKIVESTADDQQTEWRVGPRGKTEIGTKGVQGLVREVYGDNAPDDLEKRLDRSLGLGKRKVTQAEDEEVEAAEANGGPSSRATKRGRGRRAEDEDDDE